MNANSWTEKLSTNGHKRATMAENHYFIFIANQPLPDITQLLPKLGLAQYKPVAEVELWQTNKPDTLFVGHYNNSLIVAHPTLPFHFFGEGSSETEKRFIACFPNTEIAALIENTTVNLVGFSIIQNGQKIRMKDGADNKYFNDFGALIQEEKESLLKSHIDPEEIEDMQEAGMDEEEIEQHLQFQSDWGVPNLISKRYLGDYLSNIKGKVKIIKYELSNNDR